MKSLSNLCSKIIEIPQAQTAVYVHEYFTEPQVTKKLDTPVLSTDFYCPFCKGKEHYTPLSDPKVSHDRTWLCANAFCRVNNLASEMGQYVPLTKSSRCLEWASFCENNGIGDLHHQVSFEKVNKKGEGAILALSKFAKNPFGIMLLTGNPGTGKTYASMAICELYCRTRSDVIFITHENLVERWFENFKNQLHQHFFDRIQNDSLLVIDDFGTGEVSDAFLKFFMKIINYRIQWKGKGTIISTNMTIDDLTKRVGQALSDRIKAGQLIHFTGNSRR